MAREEGIFRFRRAAFRIASWTLLSRVLGLVRDRLMYGLFGRGFELGSFHVAWTVPNTFRRLLGEGALTASFVPVLTRRLEQEGLDGARRTFASVLGALIVVLVALTGIGWAVVELLPDTWLNRGQPGGDSTLLRNLLFLLLPYLIPVCMMTLAAAAQNVAGRFALPAAAPALLNAVWITGVVIAASLDIGLERRMLVVGLVLLAGGLCQVLLQVPGLVRSRMLAAPRLALGDPDLRQVARNMVPMVLGLSVVQLNTLATQILAYALVDSGAPSILFLANRMLEFPHALLGVALGTAVFPLLAVLGDRGDAHGMRQTIDRALSLGLFLALPAACGLFALAPWLIEVLFVTGRFTQTDANEATVVLRILCAVLPGLIGVQILARSHYALGSMKTPVRIAASLFAVAQLLNVVLAPLYGTAGLAISSAVCGTANAVLLHLTLRKHRVERGSGAVFRAALRSGLAAVPTAAAAWLAAAGIARSLPGDAGLVVRAACLLVVPGAIGAAVFVATARLLHAPEVGQLFAALRRKRG